MTKDELKYIRLHYYKDTPREIAEALGRSVNCVRAAARNMGYYRGKARPMRKCEGCQLWHNGHCIFRNEGEGQRCKAMRYTHAKWPEPMSDLEIRRLIL